jgi:hypothetical protein
MIMSRGPLELDFFALFTIIDPDGNLLRCIDNKPASPKNRMTS